MSRTVAVLAAAAALALGACGSSEEDQARDDVCDARADIERQVNELKELTPSTATVDQVRENVEAIGNDLRKIGEAQGQLSDERRSEIQAANQALTAELREIGSTILRSTSVEEARAQLEAAVTQLGASYSNTLAKFDCG